MITRIPIKLKFITSNYYVGIPKTFKYIIISSTIKVISRI